MSKKSKFTPWVYVLSLDDQVVGGFTSAALAYAHWLAFAEKYSSPDAPFAHVSRYRYSMDPYMPEHQDVTMIFARQWQAIRDLKNKKEQ